MSGEGASLSNAGAVIPSEPDTGAGNVAPARSGDLLALAERCQQATGPDRELDAEIACVGPLCDADWVIAANPAIRAGMVTRHFDGGSHGTCVAPDYTASLDAAMTLVPEGWCRTVTWLAANREASAKLFRADRHREPQSRAATEALALCAAALRARAAMAGDGS